MSLAIKKISVTFTNVVSYRFVNQWSVHIYAFKESINSPVYYRT